MASYKELKAKAEDLMRQAEAARKAETAADVADIRQRNAPVSRSGAMNKDLAASVRARLLK